MPIFAAIDIGSNSVRLSIARLSRGRLQVLHQDREVTRLGKGVFTNGTLDPQAIAHTIKVLKRFHRAVQDYSADQTSVDRKSTRLNSSHVSISYAVFCLKKHST